MREELEGNDSTAPRVVTVTRDLQWRDWAVISFIVLWLAIQIGVPLWQLTNPRPARFGWQMYADAKYLPRITGIRTDGGSVRLSGHRYLANFRYEFRPSYIQVLGEHICRVEPSLWAVELRLRPEGTVIRQLCSQGVPR
jgi:hypothetical protein